MKKEWFNIASIYIGTVIGAGFASGREIIEFLESMELMEYGE